MRLSRLAQTLAACGALTCLVAVATPAMAQGMDDALPDPGMAPMGADMRPVWKQGPAHAMPMQGQMLPQQPVVQGPDPAARAAWLSECRRRAAMQDDGLGGALLGGLAGGVLGNRIGGRHHRTIGTMAGVAVGAVVGSAIDKGEDAGRVKDYCEAYLDDYYAQYARGGYAQQGYAVQMVMVPVAQQHMQGGKRCTETVVTEEFVEEQPVRRRVRHIHRAPDKRVRLVPDKRVRMD